MTHSPILGKRCITRRRPATQDQCGWLHGSLPETGFWESQWRYPGSRLLASILESLASALLPVAGHSGVTVTVSLGVVCDHPLLHRAARMDASDWNHWSGICVSASVSEVSRFRLGSGVGSGEDS